MANFQVVELVGLSGGLCLLWSDAIQCIFLYLSTDRVTRRRQFDELVTKYTKWGSSWTIAGDFNNIIDDTGKIGGRARESWSFNDFKIFIWKLNGIDLGYKGKPWTWWCYRKNEGVIQERLDRTLGSPHWRAKFDNANVIHVETEASDHVALIISTETSLVRKKKRFYFDKRWCDKEEITGMIQRA
ncbi:uncharacterized protein LOC142174418 [Nicotiana tabacum]|uniref:Uncharacterized protein LOC142174418 n=1 Tax=Nicotiana tabacum TaxID=4097 RepID=A0AC58TGF9_TOBAC